jgi:hypothetical protein
VGLRRPPEAATLPGPDQRADDFAAARHASGLFAPEVGGLEGGRQIVRASRPVVLWRLDYQRLATARDAFAPDVPIEDTTGRYAPR